MKRALVILLAAAALAGCAASTPAPDAFAFAVMGDTPYSEHEHVKYLEMLRTIDNAPVAFVIHVGDIKGGGACSDELFAQRKREFDASAHPFVYTPGDNEWTDCRGAGSGPRDPLERLQRLRSVFFADERSLGRDPMPLQVQDHCVDAACRCPAYRENRRWSRSGVVFATLNVPGSENNVGFDAASDAEAKCRDQANLAWLDQATDLAAAGGRALVVAMQADIFNNKRHGYDALLAKLPQCARRLGAKPLLLVHGDTHSLTIDQPFADATGQPIANLMRLETYGSPFVGWVRVTVDPASPNLFSFDPRLEAVALP